jgi:RNA polymerase sigma factor (sigma-70 family)
MAGGRLTPVIRFLRRIPAPPAGETATNGPLLQRFIQQGDGDAFALLVRRHGPMVLRVCRRVLGHEHDAEDAFQAVFVALAGSAAKIRRREALGGWLHGVAHRTALKARRTAARRRRREAKAESPAPPALPGLLWEEVRTVLDEEVQRLAEPFRSAFVLCVLEGKSGPEAAAELGCKQATLYTRMKRARGLLQKALTARGIELAALLGALAVADGATRAAPAALVGTAVRFGLLVAAGEPAAGVIPSHVAALAAGVTRAMFLTKTKFAAILLVAAGLFAAGAGVLRHRTLAAQAAQDSPPPAAKAPPRPPAAKPPAADDRESLTLAGRVHDPDGKPVAGAKLFVPRPKTANAGAAADFALEKVGTTDGEGRFQLRVARPGQQRLFLLAHAAGFGVDWIDLGDGKPTKDLTLRLVKDVPIRGRIVNPEGRPIAGISVAVTGIGVPPNDKLDDFLAGWLRDPRDQLNSWKKALDNVPLEVLGSAAVTDKDGRFTLHGAGSERIALIAAYGGVARSTVLVLTRPDFDPGPYNAVLRKYDEFNKKPGMNTVPRLHPPSLALVAAPGKTIEGTVKDAASGKPLAGCRLSVVGVADADSTVSNPEGKYRLEGLPKNNQGYSIYVSSPEGGTHLSRIIQAADTEGFSNVRLDVELVKGAVVTGRVVDKQSGKAVQCGIRFAPLPGNPFFASRPGFDNYSKDRTMASTDRDGRFRLVTIPGKALVMAQVHQGEKVHGKHLCPYRRAVPDPDHKDLFKPEGDSWIVQTAGGIEFPSIENAVKVIEIKEDGDTNVELFVDRGTTARIDVRDADGKPLSGTWASGLTDHPPITYQLPEATAAVYALDPTKPRTMAFLHIEKKLGGTAVVRGDEKEPVVVKLAPLGRVSGRLLDGDGKPLGGVEVSIHPESEIGRELYRFATPSGSPVRTDKDGHFRLESVVAGLNFWLLRREGDYFVPEQGIGVKQVKAGEKLELGDIGVKPDP